jgi:hypothetical protein
LSGDLFDGLMRYKRETEAAILRGMKKAGLALLRDCINEVPLKQSTLRGSSSVFVDDALVSTGADLGYSEGTPATDGGQPPQPGRIVTTVGFNTPYAAYQHEGMRKDGSHVVRNYSEPDTGPKFIENRLAQGGEYLGIVAAEIKKGGGDASVEGA